MLIQCYMETSDVFLAAYLSSYSPGNAILPMCLKLRKIKLDLREMIDVSIKEISDYTITNGFLLLGKKTMYWYGFYMNLRSNYCPLHSIKVIPPHYNRHTATLFVPLL